MADDRNFLGPISDPTDAAIAHVERRSSHCYRERIDMPDGTEIETFICGQLGPPCACGAVSTVLCDFPIGEEKRTCDAPCCERCAPTIGHDKNFCPAHQAAGAGPNMLLFKPKPRERTAAENSALVRVMMRKPRLPKAPPPERRWRVCRQETSGTTCVIAGWMPQWAAYKYVKALANPATYYVETWDQFVTWHRKTYPLAPRKPKKR